MPGDERHTLCNTIVNLVKVARSHGADKEELADALGTSDSANILTDEGITAEISRLIENVQGREPSSGTNAKSRRFKDRDIQLLDLIDRFEGKPSSEHVHNARSAIERLRSEGSTFWEEGAPQLNRWRNYCNILWRFIQTSLGKRRHKNPDVTETLREFFREFEHSSHGIREMLHGIPDDPDKDQKIKQVFDWLDLVYRFSTYAITAFWIDDKTEEVLTEISRYLVTGEGSQKTTIEKEMKVPKKHRRGARDL